MLEIIYQEYGDTKIVEQVIGENKYIEKGI